MSTDFHEIIHSNGKAYDFQFLKMNSVLEDKFFISVVKDLTFYRFCMILINRNWRIGNAYDVPEWIVNLEKTLSTTISSKIKGH